MGTRTFDQAGNRTDIHAPRHFDPSDYEVIGYADLKPIVFKPWPGMTAAAYENAKAACAEAEAYRRSECVRLFGTEWPSRSCGHCGYSPLRWVTAAKHLPTGEVVVFGEICDETRLSLPNRQAFSSKFIRTAAENLRRHLEKLAEVARNQAEYSASGDDEALVASFLTHLPEDEGFDFLVSMKADYAKWGRLFPNQTAAVLRCMVKRMEPKVERVIPTVPLVEGRRVVEGTIVSLKYQDSDFGTTLKMLVVEECGTKVWMTCPSKLDAEKGDKVRVTVTVTRSRDDQFFGFGSRPVKGEVV